MDELAEHIEHLTVSKEKQCEAQVTKEITNVDINNKLDVGTLKHNLRIQIWARMEKQKLIHEYPPSCFDKIPYFIKCEIAAKKVARLKEFRDAKLIKINPSLAQMHLRFLTLKYGKQLLVPNPSLTDDFMYLIDPKLLKHPWQLKRASSKAGSKELGSKMKLSDSVKIDLFVVASVVCAANGVRLGKGMGYAEIEWAILYEIGAVNSQTLVLTTVHDEQILANDKLPLSLLCNHDLPIDIIVTPSKIINVRKRLKKPCIGIDWSLITKEQLLAMPILQSLKSELKNK